MKTRKVTSKDDLSVGMNIIVSESSCESRLAGRTFPISTIRDYESEYPVEIQPEDEMDKGITCLGLDEFYVIEPEEEVVDASYSEVVEENPSDKKEMIQGEFYKVQILIPQFITVTKVGGQIFRADKISGVINLKPFLGAIDHNINPSKLLVNELTDLPF